MAIRPIICITYYISDGTIAIVPYHDPTSDVGGGVLRVMETCKNVRERRAEGVAPYFS